MSAINDGGSAFPFPADHTCNGSNGMSLRDWFAGQALAGMCANPAFYQTPSDKFAKVAFLRADAMLAARSAVSAAREAKSP